MISELDEACINCIHGWILRTPHPLMNHILELYKVCNPYSMIFLSRSPMFEWHVVLYGLKTWISRRHVLWMRLSYILPFELIISKVIISAINSFIKYIFSSD